MKTTEERDENLNQAATDELRGLQYSNSP